MKLHKLQIILFVLVGLVFSQALSLDISATAPDSLPGLKLWLDASDVSTITGGGGASVTQWRDKSGNNNHANGYAPTYVASDPDFNNKASIYFGNNGMVTPLSLVTPYSVFIVYNADSHGGNRRAIQGSSNWFIGPYQNYYQHYAGGFSNAGAVVVDEAVVSVALSTSSEKKFYHQDEDHTSSPTAVSNPGTIGLGNQGAYGEPLYGNIAEIVIYDRQVTDLERIGVQDYLSDKYDLGLPGLSLDKTFPIDNGSVGYNSELTMEFSRTVGPGTGNIVIYNNDNSVFETIDITDASKVSFNDTNFIMINPSQDFVKGAAYYILIDDGAIVSGARDYPGITSATEWNFTSEPFTTTGLKLWLDADEMESIVKDINGVVSQWLDKSGNVNHAVQGNVDRQPQFVASDAEFNNRSVIFFDDENDGMGTGLVINSGDYTVALVYNLEELPVQNLSRAVQGSSGYNWLLGPYNAYAQYYASGWVNFRTATEFPKLKIEDNGSILNVARKQGNSNNYRYQAVDFTGGSSHYGYFNNLGLGTVGHYFEPLGGNIAELLVYNRALSGDEVNEIEGYLGLKWGIDIPPQIVALSPPDNSTGVVSDTNLSMTFSTQVYISSGYITIRKSSDGSIHEKIPIGSPRVIGSGTSVITVDPLMDLEDGTSYYVTVDSSALKSDTGKAFAGILNTTTWNFDVVDNEPPSVTSFVPPDDGQGMIDTDLIINFSEPVDIQSGNLTLYTLNNSVAVEQVNLESAQVSGNGTALINVDLTRDLMDDVEYYVNLPANAFLDDQGLGYVGISDNSTWNFRAENWYDTKWIYRIKLTVQHSKVMGDVVDYPVFVDLSDLPDEFFDHVKSDGSDIRVTDGGGIVELPREKVFIDTNSKTGEIHFKAEGLLSSTVNGDFYIYYGNPNATEPAVDSTYGAENVWNENYIAVYHMEESPSLPAPQIKDSTKNDHHGTSSASMGAGNNTTGKLSGRAMNFPSINDSIDVADADTLDVQRISMAMWVNFNATPTTIPVVACKENINESYLMFVYNNDVYWRLFVDDEFEDVIDPLNVSLYNYEYWVGTFSGVESKFYRNSILKANTTLDPSQILTSTAQSFKIGRCGPSANNAYNGIIDELRLSDVARTAEWVGTAYNNQNQPSTFYFPGPEERFDPGAGNIWWPVTP